MELILKALIFPNTNVQSVCFSCTSGRGSEKAAEDTPPCSVCLWGFRGSGHGEALGKGCVFEKQGPGTVTCSREGLHKACGADDLGRITRTPREEKKQN